MLDRFLVKAEVKQGSVIIPILFALYVEDISLEFDGFGYADDIVMFAESPSELQEMMDVWENCCR